MPKPHKPSGLALTLFCILAVMALPFSVLCAIIAGLGGDTVLLRVLRGKVAAETDTIDTPAD